MYKTILVHVDNGKHCPKRLDIAVQLAQRYEAHLVGLHALSPEHLAALGATEAAPIVIEAQKRRAAEAALVAQTVFRRAVEKAGLANSEWRTSSDEAVAAITLHARYADLVVMGQPDPEDSAGVDAVVAHEVVLAAGRPVLFVPFAGRFEQLGTHVLLAWNGSREATRAATDALPLLRQADKVSVVTVNPHGRLHGDIPGADIGLYLARHGVRVDVSTIVGTEVDAGNLLLSRAADLGCDLIVMGAYGHSRLRELVLGGVTRTLFDSMTVPTLMSH
jgi:nucleotide-binding universal stress UspA family protein